MRLPRRRFLFHKNKSDGSMGTISAQPAARRSSVDQQQDEKHDRRRRWLKIIGTSVPRFAACLQREVCA